MTENPEKKIIVDEDWKSQVQREREEAARKEPETGPAQGPEEIPDVELPAASLIYLAGTLFHQGLMFLGLMPHPSDGKLVKNLAVARHSIDLLDVLQQKTEGNRTPEESEEIEGMLHQLRMAYVQVAK